MSAGFRPTRGGAFLSLAEMMVRGAACACSTASGSPPRSRRSSRPSSTQFGQTPDFIDGHQHVHLFPQVREALLDVVKDAAPQAWVRQCGRVPTLPRADRGLQDADARCAERQVPRARRGARHRDQSGVCRRLRFHLGERARISRGCFRAFSASCRPQSVVMCHPGFVDAELERLDPLTTQREREYAYFAGDGVPRACCARTASRWPETASSAQGLRRRANILPQPFRRPDAAPT